MSLVDTLLQLPFRFIVNTLYGAYLSRSYVGTDGLLRQHFPENVCAVPLLLLLLLLLLLFILNCLSYRNTFIATKKLIRFQFCCLKKLAIDFKNPTQYTLMNSGQTRYILLLYVFLPSRIIFIKKRYC